MVTPTGATPRATSRTWPRLPGQAAGASTGTHTSACGRALLGGSRAAGARRLRARRGRARSRGAALLDAQQSSARLHSLAFGEILPMRGSHSAE
jgi:hypothetical protein